MFIYLHLFLIKSTEYNLKFFAVLGPLSCNAKLKLNMNPELDVPAYVNPKIDLSMEMERLNVGLTNTQFHNIMQLGDSMNRMQLGVPYRQYRPYDIRMCIGLDK